MWITLVPCQVVFDSALIRSGIYAAVFGVPFAAILELIIWVGSVA